MRWVCVLFPHLALDGVLRRDHADGAPLALVSGPPQRRVVRAICPDESALGLRPGQSLSSARTLASNLRVAEYDPLEIERWRGFLAAWAYRFSSQVSLHYPQTLLMEVGSSLGLFGPWPQLEARLREELSALGFRHRIVVAPNPAAARALANAHDGLAVADRQALCQRLGNMPVERVGLPREVATALSRMGLRTVRQVLALPRDALARRFPQTVLQHLDVLLGERALVLEFYAPPDFFDSRIELNFDVTSHQALLFPLRRLTADLAAFLAGRDSGVQRFTLYLEHAQRARTEVAVGLLSAERDPAMLFELARGRLEQVSLCAPTQAMQLTARDLPAFVPEHRALFDERAQQTLPWEKLRERLRARLGDEAVHGLTAQADHRPERAWQTDGEGAVIAAYAAGRPGWLLSRPQVLRDNDWRVLAGPERIETGWWDGDDIRRDYYLIESRKGQRGWAYRVVGERGPLLLHGWFA